MKPPPHYKVTVFGSNGKFGGKEFNGGEQLTYSSLTEAHKELRHFQQDKDSSSSCFSLEPLLDCRYHTTTKFLKHDRVYMIDDPSIKGTIVSARKRRLQDWQKLCVLTDDGVRFSTCSYFRIVAGGRTGAITLHATTNNKKSKIHEDNNPKSERTVTGNGGDGFSITHTNACW